MKDPKVTHGIALKGLEALIEAGIKKLKQFGFTNVTKDNIFSDEVYCFFLVRFMNSLKGRTTELDVQIDRFLEALEQRNGTK